LQLTFDEVLGIDKILDLPFFCCIPEGRDVIIESCEDSSRPTPYIHFFSIGSKQTMLQVWLDGTTLIFRFV